MATPRQTIADQLISDHTATKEYAVYPWLYSPTSDLRKPAIAVYRTDVEPHPTNPNLLRHPVTIDAYGKKVIGEAVEDELDDLLDDIMLSLQRIDGVYDVKAKRSTFKDSFHGWTITLHVDSENIYKTVVLNERP
jgi:hypothetical protein